MTTPTMAYPLPRLRIVVNFADRTDGPTSVEVEVNDADAELDIGQFINAVVDAARRRRLTDINATGPFSIGRSTWTTSSADAAEVTP